MSNEFIVTLIALANAYVILAIVFLDGPFDIFIDFRSLFVTGRVVEIDENTSELEVEFIGFFGKLISCPYCFGFWTSLIAALLTTNYLHLDTFLFFVLWLAYAVISPTIASLE